MLAELVKSTPLMQPVDAVKLAYQRAFGIGHMLGEPAAVVARIQAELQNVPPDPAAQAYTPIGRGLCRLNLAAPAVRGASPDTLARAMRLTEARFTPSREVFEADIAELQALAERGDAPFSGADFAEYMRLYRASGCPVVSHSDIYRAAYSPAYRVVLSDIGVLAPVLAAIGSRLRDMGRALVAIDGDCGSGKSTLADILSVLYNAPVLHMDDFFLPFEKRTQQRKRVAGWCVDWERFLSEVLHGLMRGGAFEYRRYDCATGEYLMREHSPAPVTVIEGSYSHHPQFGAAYAELDPITVFVTVDEREQARRLEARDFERFGRFVSEWIPLEKTYFEAYDLLRGADIALQSQPWEDEP